MLIKAYQNADDSQRAELQKWISLKDFDKQEKIKSVTDLYNQIGIKELCEKKIASYFGEANKYLDQVDVDEDRKRNLRDFTKSMMKRNY
jgi:geranylgeranyl diphosphate synthase type II